MTYKHALLASTSAALMFAAGGAYAQETPSGTAVEEVIVTGSRILRDGYQQPTPVTVVQSDQLLKLAPSNLADGLRQLPQFQRGVTPNSGGVSAGADVGSNLLSLRNLGSQRTLVLLDGRRFVSSSDTDSTDINTLPQNVVARVETVTGGASAAYGSDAVAGVVNFILDKSFTGWKGSVQTGISSYGDSEANKANLAYGSRFADDRGHFIFSGEYSSRDGIGPYDTSREWNSRQIGILTNPNFTADLANGPRRLTFQNGVTTSAATLGGLITAASPSPAALQWTQFGEGGAPRPFVLGQFQNGTHHVNGDGFAEDSNQSTGLKRWTLFARGDYDISENMNVFLELSYAGSEAEWDQYYSYAYTTNSPYIFINNPYLPAATQAAMAAATYTTAQSTACATAAGFLPNTINGVATPVEQRASNSANWANTRCFRMGRLYSEAMIGAAQEKEVFRVAGGVTGNFTNGWNYEAYFNQGKTNARKSNLNVNHLVKMVRAYDVIRDTTGAIRCAALVPDALRPAGAFGPNAAYTQAAAERAAGCAPLNPFGAGSPSEASIDYTHGDEHYDLKREQANFAVNIGGELPSWTQFGYAAPSFATGFEYRKETITVTTNLETQEVMDFTSLRGGLTSRQGNVGPFIVGNFQPHSGGGVPNNYSVNEAYLELDVPVLQGLPLAHLLDFNGAFRATDYSNSGKVETWKLGVVYEPHQDVRFRATRSRDIRAPSGDDLFSGAGQGVGTTTNPFVPGTTISWLGKTGGNPDLRPEIADTVTAGVVYSPSFVPGLRMSVDYFEIKIADAIGSLTAVATINQCFEGNQSLCNLIVFGPDLYTVNATLINLSEQRIKGWDVEASYGFDVGPGRLSTRALAVYQPENIRLVPGSAPDNLAGMTSRSGSAKLTANLSLNYAWSRYSITLQQQYTSGMVIDNTWVEGVDIDENEVAPHYTTDLNASVRFGADEQYEGFVSINNLLNRDPPFAPLLSGLRQRYTDQVLFDTFGRYFTVGLKFRY